MAAHENTFANPETARRPPPQEPGTGGRGGDIGVRELLNVMRRRLGYFVGTVLPLTILAAIVIPRITPQYTAETQVLIEESTGQAMSIDAVVGGLSGDMETVQSEAFVLQSAKLADRVIEKLDLAADPEFNPLLQEPDRERWSGLSATDEADLESSLVNAEFQERLDVLPQAGSRVIAVQFTSEKPQLAANVANVLAEEYLLSRIEAKYESTRRASGWLSDRIAELRTEVEDSERKIESLRQEYGLLQGNGITLASQELAELNTELVLARSERAEVEARLRQVSRLLGSSGGAATANEVLDSSLIQSLREQQSQVERRVAELSTELGELHPRMVQLRAEAQDLRDRIDREVAKIVAGLENSVTVARAREQSLAGSLEDIKKTVGESNQRDVELRALEREAEANRQLLATMLARQKEALSQEDIDFQQADARIISPASVPIEPSFPKPAILLVLVVLGSAILGLLIVAVAELLDAGFRSGEEIEEATGTTTLGFLPRVSAKGLSPFERFKQRPGTAFGEAVRTLGWTLSLVFPGGYPTTVLVTSSVVAEGKTVTACCLAESLAQGGRKVLLIDADLRRPGVHGMVNVLREPGLVDVLAGIGDLDMVTQNSEGNLTVLSAGTQSPNPGNLIGSLQMKELLARVGEKFDVVVIDSPPVMVGADARLLAEIADATVFVVQWAKTGRATVRHCLGQLKDARANIAGALLTKVDARKHSLYGYGDSGAYAGDMEKYYAG